jgi:hypothetical protein
VTARVTLPGQIAALDAAIDRLQRQYTVAVDRGQMRRRDADAHLSSLRAVRATLLFVRQHEHLIRSAVIGGPVKHAV